MNPIDSVSATNDDDLQPTDRRGLVLSVGALAALAGVGVAWWLTPTGAEPQSAELDRLWDAQWENPLGGANLPMRQFRGSPLVLNFWATWCPPCVEELPLINDFYRANRGNGWQVLGLAVDKRASVQNFLKKMPLDFPVGLAGSMGADLGRKLGNLTGGLPFSVLIGGRGAVLHRKMGRLTADDLKEWVRLK
jgi:thiol-disulfide isomerase/thioredoxin